jgi:PncC family amidohydrolase
VTPGLGAADVLAIGIVRALTERGLTVAVAESLTGGLVVATLVQVPGASAVLRGGVVAYATDLKASLLGVDPDLLAREGAVHPEVARQMAYGVAERLGADLGLATTGVAGPDRQDGRPVGEVHLALAGPGLAFTGHALALPARLGRDGIRREATAEALDLLLDRISA